MSSSPEAGDRAVARASSFAGRHFMVRKRIRFGRRASVSPEAPRRPARRGSKDNLQHTKTTPVRSTEIKERTELAG